MHLFAERLQTVVVRGIKTKPGCKFVDESRGKRKVRPLFGK